MIEGQRPPGFVEDTPTGTGGQQPYACRNSRGGLEPKPPYDLGL